MSGDQYEPHPYTAEGMIAGLGRFADGLNRVPPKRGPKRPQTGPRLGHVVVILTLGLMVGGLISGLVFGLR